MTSSGIRFNGRDRRGTIAAAAVAVLLPATLSPGRYELSVELLPLTGEPSKRSMAFVVR